MTGFKIAVRTELLPQYKYKLYIPCYCCNYNQATKKFKHMCKFDVEKFNYYLIKNHKNVDNQITLNTQILLLNNTSTDWFQDCCKA